MNHDIRWIQRFENFKKGFQQLNFAENLSKERELTARIWLKMNIYQFQMSMYIFS
jgi:hypothetical protein